MILSHVSFLAIQEASVNRADSHLLSLSFKKELIKSYQSPQLIIWFYVTIKSYPIACMCPSYCKAANLLYLKSIIEFNRNSVGGAELRNPHLNPTKISNIAND